MLSLFFGQSIPEGLGVEVRLKYLCAFINDTRRLDENTEQLLEVVSPHV